MREQLPLLPDQIRDKLEKEYNLTPREVDILVRMSDQPEGEGMSGLVFFETVAHGREARTVANWCVHAPFFPNSRGLTRMQHECFLKDLARSTWSIYKA